MSFNVVKKKDIVAENADVSKNFDWRIRTKTIYSFLLKQVLFDPGDIVIAFGAPGDEDFFLTRKPGLGLRSEARNRAGELAPRSDGPGGEENNLENEEIEKKHSDPRW